MISGDFFFRTLKDAGIDFFCGVPDSLLKSFCMYLAVNCSSPEHIITANEGNAVALAAGHYLATSKPGLVYMQNSGFGNAINPLVSLTDPNVYGIPLLLLIGLRGEPGVADEPQHITQGKITPDLLDILGIMHDYLPDEPDALRASVRKAINYILKNGRPFAFIVKKGVFDAYRVASDAEQLYPLLREEALGVVVDRLDGRAIVVSSTGKLSRELYEYREKTHGGHGSDFLTVGSMGHASQIALGIALSRKDREIYCLDGDGAVLMHMGAIPTIGKSGAINFRHIIFNNGAHDSVGGESTVAGFDIDFLAIAKACGYTGTFSAETKEEIRTYTAMLKEINGPSLLEIRIRTGAREDLGRPVTSPEENKKYFMDNLIDYAG